MPRLKYSFSSLCLCKMCACITTTEKETMHLSCVKKYHYILVYKYRSILSRYLLSLFFQLLAYLLKRKTQLLNTRILQLMFSLVGTAELGFESSVIRNHSAFQYVLCNFEVKLLMLLWDKTVLKMALWCDLEWQVPTVVSRVFQQTEGLLLRASSWGTHWQGFLSA